MAGMTPEQILAVLGKTRQKGQYQGLVVEFLDSGEAGVHAQSQWPQLGEKKASTIKQGFEGALKRKEAPDGSDGVRVLVQDEQVYLINSSLAAEQIGQIEGAAA